MKRRTRVAEGVWRDRWGLAGVVKVDGHQREQRFPPTTSTDLIQRWRTRTRAELETDATNRAEDAGPEPERGTFAADLPRYLKQIAGRVAFKSDRSHLRAWLPFIGPLLRSAVKSSHVRLAMASWSTAGKSARTIRHRIRVLREMYRTLDGVHARPPLAGVKLPRPADPHPTAVPHATIQRVAKSLKAGKRHEEGYGSDSEKGYARFLVRATTGQRPTQIMRAVPGDVDLRRRVWFVRAAKGGYAIPLPLTTDMVHAWRAFIEADAWGTFNTRSFSHLLRRHGWPRGTRPYTLRHTFSIDLLRAGAPLEHVQVLLGHRQIETTRKFYGRVAMALVKKAADRRKLKLA